MAEAIDVKFGTQLEFAKAHHHTQRKTWSWPWLGKHPNIWGSPLIFLQRPRCPLGVSGASCYLYRECCYCDTVQPVGLHPPGVKWSLRLPAWSAGTSPWCGSWSEVHHMSSSVIVSVSICTEIFCTTNLGLNGSSLAVFTNHKGDQSPAVEWWGLQLWRDWLQKLIVNSTDRNRKFYSKVLL